MAAETKPLPDDREEAAVEVLRRIYERDFGAGPLYDDGMVVNAVDEEIAAFIRRFGPF